MVATVIQLQTEKDTPELGRQKLFADTCKTLLVNAMEPLIGHICVYVEVLVGGRLSTSPIGDIMIAMMVPPVRKNYLALNAI